MASLGYRLDVLPETSYSIGLELSTKYCQMSCLSGRDLLTEQAAIGSSHSVGGIHRICYNCLLTYEILNFQRHFHSYYDMAWTQQRAINRGLLPEFTRMHE